MIKVACVKNYTAFFFDGVIILQSFISIYSVMRLHNNVVSLVFLLYPTFTGAFSPTQEVS